jgi:radical SAM protein with 4Fe4S-binding SPASM domain
MEHNKSITVEEMYRIIDSAYDMRVKKISLSGGEPLLWSGILELFSYQKLNNFEIKIYTSGTTKNFQNIISKINHPNICFVFSMFGSQADIHDKITGEQGSFHKTVEAIKQCKVRFNTEIHFVPLSLNHSQLRPLALYANDLGVDKISVLRFVPQGRGSSCKQFILAKEEDVRLRKEIIDLREAGFNIRTGSPYNYLFINPEPHCSTGVDKLIIAPDLSIYPCDAFKQVSVNKLVGEDEFSSLRHHSLSECWEKSKYLNKIREVLKAEFIEPCKSCPKLTICQSGCLAQKLILRNELKNTQDPSCLLH